MATPDALVTGAKLITQASQAAENLRALLGGQYEQIMASWRDLIRRVAIESRTTPGHPATILAALKLLKANDEMEFSGVVLAAWWWFAHEGGK